MFFRPLFKDRREAGWMLAQKLKSYSHFDTVVLGLPRGGVVVAYEVARVLKAPLHAFVVRKLGTPGHEELAMGAIASGGVRVLNDDVIMTLGIPQSAIDRVVRKETIELKRREILYGEDLDPLNLTEKTALLIDDGLATGATMQAAIEAVRMLSPARVVVAVPVGALETCQKIASHVDDLVCLHTPEPFYSVGNWYENFAATEDAEVCELLRVRREEMRRKESAAAV